MASVCTAQVPPVTQAPPAITFNNWQLVGPAGEATQYSVSFQSALPSEYAVNNTVPLSVYVPTAAKGPVPAVVVLHYWGATDLKVERALALELARKNIGCVVMTLPYHLSRTPEGYRSGALAVQADPEHLVTTMTQSVMDVRRAIDFIQSRPEFDKNSIGVAGTSLGSLVAALSFGVEPRIRYAAFVLGGVDLARIIWTSSRVVAERETLRSAGYTEDLLREQLRPIEPKEYLSSKSPNSSFIIGARYDTVIPRAATMELIEALPGAKTLWMDTGHYGGVFVENKILREVSKFFASKFTATDYQPPANLHAPTVRLGADLATGTGFDIAAGLDLIRPKNDRSLFMSLLVSPRGPRAFLGQGVDRGVAVGVIFTTKQPGIGVLWSTVL